MICDICHKREATVHLTEIINDQVTELHLCEECAKEKGSEVEQHFDLADLLAGLTDSAGAKPASKEELNIKCPNCKMTYADLKKIGRLGCSQCYTVFKKSLAPLLKRIHGSTQHVGKAPKRLAKETKQRTQLQVLKAELEKLIRLESFEEAVKIRDKIKELEKKEQKKTSNDNK